MDDQLWRHVDREIGRVFWQGVACGAVYGTGLTCLFFLFVGWFL